MESREPRQGCPISRNLNAAGPEVCTEAGRRKATAWASWQSCQTMLAWSLSRFPSSRRPPEWRQVCVRWTAPEATRRFCRTQIRSYIHA